jgi:hypothetical protein
MSPRKPLPLTLAGAIFVNCIGVGYGVHLFSDVPPLAITAGSTTGSTYMAVYATPAYNTVTDERIEAPVIQKDKVVQS